MKQEDAATLPENYVFNICQLRLPSLLQGGQTQRTFSGSGANEDIVVASARAYISALNKLIAFVSASQRAAESAATAPAGEHDHEQHAVAA